MKPQASGPIVAALVGILAGAACASKQHATPSAVGPCQDSLYLALRARPVDSLSEREFQLLRDRDRVCLETATLSAAGPARSAPPASVNPNQVQGSTEAGLIPGTTDLYIENLSAAEIVISAVRLYDCVNITTACTVTRPQVRIPPGQELRVGMVRAMPESASSFRWEYHYEPVSAR